jgi:hypothetical protein
MSAEHAGRPAHIDTVACAQAVKKNGSVAARGLSVNGREARHGSPPSQTRALVRAQAPFERLRSHIEGPRLTLIRGACLSLMA